MRKNTIFLFILLMVLAMIAACTRENPLGIAPTTPVPVVVPEGTGGDIEDPNVYALLTDKYATDFYANGGNVFYWDESITGTGANSFTAPEGTSLLDLTVTDTKDWNYFGWGIAPASPTNMTFLSNWYLNFWMKSSDVTNVRVGILDSTVPDTWLLVKQYGFVADGAWHRIIIPMKDIKAAAGANLNLADVTYPFAHLYNFPGSIPANAWHYQLDGVYWTKYSNY